jgi:hypothetical protein
MKMTNYTYHVNMFNDRLRSMNQTRSADMRLSAVEANNLMSDIVGLLTQISDLSAQLTAASNATVEVVMDGGGFK